MPTSGWYSAALVIAAVFFAQSSTAEVITICRGIGGKTIFVKPKSGWVDDKMKGDLVVSLDTTNGAENFDIAVVGTEYPFSARADGGKVDLLSAADFPSFTLGVRYPLGAVEVYQFVFDKPGQGTLIWTTTKHAPIARGSVFTAHCAPPR